MAEERRGLPIMGNHGKAQLFPDGPALARTVDASIDSATSITLNDDTTIIRVYAFDQDVYGKLGATTITSSNQDDIIPAGQIVDVPIPVDTSTGVRYNTYQVIARESGAGVVVIEK